MKALMMEQSSVERDLLFAGVELVFCYLVLKASAWLFARHWWTRRNSRKLIHIATGPIHMAFWPLFRSSIASIASAFTPAILTLRLACIPLGWKDEELLNAMARKGDAWEFLRGPLVYGLAHVLVTVAYFNTSLGELALLVLCVGDGVASIVGSGIPLASLPWNADKSVSGTLSFMIFTLGARLLWSRALSSFDSVTIISAALVESLSWWGEWDNAAVVSVPVIAHLIIKMGF